MRRLIACLAALGTAAPVAAQSQREEVLVVVKNLFDGMRKRDTALMRAQFAPEARMIRIDKRSGTPAVASIDPSRWIGGVGKSSGPAFDERIFDPVIEQDGDIAHVWTYYEFWLGSKLSHCGYDSFFLVRLADGWKVSQVADTERTHCKPR